MYGYTYKLESTDKPSIVKLTPTNATLAKTFGIVAVMGGLPIALSYVNYKLEDRKNRDIDIATD